MALRSKKTRHRKNMKQMSLRAKKTRHRKNMKQMSLRSKKTRHRKKYETNEPPSHILACLLVWLVSFAMARFCCYGSCFLLLLFIMEIMDSLFYKTLWNAQTLSHEIEANFFIIEIFMYIYMYSSTNSLQKDRDRICQNI